MLASEAKHVVGPANAAIITCFTTIQNGHLSVVSLRRLSWIQRPLNDCCSYVFYSLLHVCYQLPLRLVYSISLSVIGTSLAVV